MKRSLVFLCLAALVFVACGDADSANNDDGGEQTQNNDTSDDGSIEVSFDFEKDPQGWTADFTDYPESSEDDAEFFDGVFDLPPNNFLDHGDHGVDTDKRAYRLVANNVSRDLFLYLKRKLDESHGIKPETEYRVEYEITWASDRCRDEDDELAYMKWGASKWEPLPRPDNDSGDHIILNVDKGDTANTGGREASVQSDTRHQLECQEAQGRFVPRQRARTHTHAIESSPDGEIWLLVGFDSEIPGNNEVYFMRIDAVLTEVECEEGDEKCEIEDAEEVDG